MTISIQDIASRFGISNPENLQMFVKWIQLSPSQKYPQKSEQMSAPNGIQLGAGQFAYITLKSETGKHVFSAYVFADSATSFCQTNYSRITLAHYLMFGKNCKDKISDIFQAYRKADETVSMEESLPRQQRLENLAKRSNGSYERFLGLAKAHDVINGLDPKQVAEIKRFWDDWSGKQHAPQQAPQQAQQAVPLAQSPFAMQPPAQTASEPLQSPFAVQQPIQAPVTPQMAPQMQTIQATLQAIYNLLQPLFAPNMAQSVAPRVR